MKCDMMSRREDLHQKEFLTDVDFERNINRILVKDYFSVKFYLFFGLWRRVPRIVADV